MYSGTKNQIFIKKGQKHQSDSSLNVLNLLKKDS